MRCRHRSRRPAAAGAVMPFDVTAVIPHFEREELLAQALESVVRQTEPPAEIIVVDDGSRRPPEAVCRRYGARLLVIDHTGKPGAVRNRGAEAAESRWLAFLDSDDLWLPEKLERQRRKLESQPEMTLCHTREIWQRGTETVSQKKQKHLREGDLFSDALKKCIIGPSTVMLSGAVFKALGGFDETLEIAEDYEFWLRWTDRFPAAYCGEPSVVKRAGGWPQLSEKYGQIEIFRIEALLRVLDKNVLGGLHRAEALREAERKIGIYCHGCRKRGRTEEALRMERLWRERREGEEK